MIRKLCHESLINLALDGVVLVVGPVVFKVALESLGHLLGQWARPVEMSEETEPLRQVFAILVVCSHILQIHQDVNELTHDVGEAGNTDKEDEGSYDSLDLTLGVVITETDGRQGSKGEIDDDDEILPVSLGIEFVFVIEGKLLRLGL